MRATYRQTGAFQQTLAGPVEFSGIGLHSGQDCAATVRPAGANEGVVFRRLDLADGMNEVAVSPRHVRNTLHGTTLSADSGASVATVEHLMAALRLAGIDNARIDLFGPEVPILDGSAVVFLNAFNEIGCDLQAAPRRELALPAGPVAVRDQDRMIEIAPGDSRAVDVTIDFEDCLIGRQSLRLDLDALADCARMASARTFCRVEEIDFLRSAGLARGGSLDNSLVVDGARLLNESGLRDAQEFALHKALDLIGDLYLLGVPIAGEIRAVKPGHDLNVRMAQALADAALAEAARSDAARSGAAKDARAAVASRPRRVAAALA